MRGGREEGTGNLVWGGVGSANPEIRELGKPCIHQARHPAIHELARAWVMAVTPSRLLCPPLTPVCLCLQEAERWYLLCKARQLVNDADCLTDTALVRGLSRRGMRSMYARTKSWWVGEIGSTRPALAPTS
jgi:hypothetical protein